MLSTYLLVMHMVEHNKVNNCRLNLALTLNLTSKDIHLVKPRAMSSNSSTSKKAQKIRKYS